MNMSKRLPQGYRLPPVLAATPSAASVAWLATLPTTAPALTAAEVTRLRLLRAAATDPRVRDRAQAVLTANGTP